MRLRALAQPTLVAFTLVLAGCNANEPNPHDCKPGTLRLDTQLNFAAEPADTIVVQSLMTPQFTRSFPVMQLSDGNGILNNLDITFDGGYPAGRALTLLVSAMLKGELLGNEEAQIHLLPGCTEGAVTVSFVMVHPPADGGTD
jgi:hypothetical protein